MLEDPDMRALAEEELPILRARLPEVEKALQLALCRVTPPTASGND